MLGLAVVLATHVVVSALASLLVAGWHRVARARLARLAPGARARRLLRLALAPSASGLSSAALAGMAWLSFEPRSTAETPGPVLVALGLLGLGVVVLRGGSAASDCARTARFVASFRLAGRELRGLSLSATRAAHPFPVAALAGVWRSRLLLSEQVLAALSADELDAVVAHELAHRDAWDNLKRLLLAASPDPLALTRSGRRLRSEFLEAAEAAADARACARVSPTVLARAVLKVARLLPPGGRLEAAVAGFHHEGCLAARVQALVEGPELASPKRASSHGVARLAVVIGLAAVLAGAVAGPQSILAALHAALERLVHLLA
jgi:Zn-dependent protease with chaperone function